MNGLQRWLAGESFQGDFRNCKRRIATDVGAPPDSSLAPIQTAIDRLCGDFAAGYRDLATSFRTKKLATYLRSQREEHQAEADVKTVRNLVDAWHPGSPALGLPTKGGLTEESRIEPRFSAAASAIAGEPVSVRCWSKADWPRIQAVAGTEGGPTPVVDGLAGLADPTVGTADLSPEICHDLVDVTYRGVRTGIGAAVGLTVLAHEATHLRGDSNTEAVTECYAMQRVGIAGSKLGVSSADARQLAHLYWSDVYPEDLPDYQTADCRSNGPFDLHPGGSWP